MDDPQALLDNGDIPGLLRHLRANAEDMDLQDVARLVEGAAAASGFDDLREAAAAVAGRGGRFRRRQAGAEQLFEFGYACIERGVAALAVPALRAALERAPGEVGIVRELVSALEREERHGDAVQVMDANASLLEAWPDRYLLAYNALMAGDVERAEDEAGRVTEPDDPMWAPVRERLARTMDRVRAVRAVSPLDKSDLRGWQFVTGGGVLLTMSPYGYDAGMAGRHAYLGDGYPLCRRTIERLQVVLDAAGVRPASVGLLPDRSSGILGLAVAELLGLPAEPFEPGRAGALVVAYDLNEVDGDVLEGLWGRADGQVLFEHATCWTDAPGVTADVSGLLHQFTAPPWGAAMRVGEDGEVERTAPDERAAAEVAAEIVRAEPDNGEGDGSAPPDPVETVAALAAAVRGQWLRGPRAPVMSAGPVRSSRFA